ncbi:hypothetical protein ASG89_05480 [Paenibacillus sp. Soil766]|nr:hypothetical protein ASG89_05480 [Paenibacillus sp. Soil766]
MCRRGAVRARGAVQRGGTVRKRGCAGGGAEHSSTATNKSDVFYVVISADFLPSGAIDGFSTVNFL